MLEQTIARKHFATERWRLLFALSVAAVLLGIVIGQEQWLYLPVIALVPLLWFWPVEVAIGTLVILIPFEHIALLSDRAVASLALVMATGVLLAVGMVGRRLQRPPTTAKWWALFIAWTVGSTLWALQPKLSLLSLPLLIALFLFYVSASSFRITEKELNWIMWAIILGGGLAALVSIYEFYSGMIVASHTVRATLVGGQAEANPNRFATRLLLPLSLAIGRFVSARHWSARVAALFFISIISWTLLLAMSRGTLLAALVIIFIYYLKLKLLRRRVASVILLVLVMAAAMPEGLSSRLKQAETDRGAGRLDIWIVGWNALKHRALLGAGISNFPLAYSEYAGYAPHFRHMTNDAHNIYLLISVEEGSIGLLLFLLALKKQFDLASKYRTQAKPNVTLLACEAGLCGILVAGFFGSIVWDKTFWLSCVCLSFAITLQSSALNPGHGAESFSILEAV